MPSSKQTAANLLGLQETLDQQGGPGYTETEISTGGAADEYTGAETIPGMAENALPFGQRNGAADEKRRETFRGNPILCGVLNSGLSSLLIRLSACATMNTARERRFRLCYGSFAVAVKRGDA